MTLDCLVCSNHIEFIAIANVLELLSTTWACVYGCRLQFYEHVFNLLLVTAASTKEWKLAFAKQP